MFDIDDNVSQAVTPKPINHGPRIPGEFYASGCSVAPAPLTKYKQPVPRRSMDRPTQDHSGEPFPLWLRRTAGKMRAFTRSLGRHEGNEPAPAVKLKGVPRPNVDLGANMD